MSLINERLSNTSCQWHHQLKYEQTEVVCSDAMQQRLEDAILTQGFVAHRLFSGAGHDGLAMASLCEIGMLFVRCKEGLSHHPDEAITAKDAEVAAQVLKSFLLAFNQESNHVV